MPAHDCSVADAVAGVSRCVRDSYPAARALILTGSTARDEATVLHAQSGARWLSDMEFLVVVPDVASLPAEAAALDALAQRASAKLESEGIFVSVELTATPERFFAVLRPQLFSYELRRHGKQLFGDSDYLGRIPAFEWTDIPKETAWRLLSNRMVEWLEFQYRRHDVPLDAQLYVLVKEYLDLLTSASLVAGEYSDCYATRAEAIPRVAEWLAGRVPRGLAERLAEGARLCAVFKLNPESEAFRWVAPGRAGDLREALAAEGLEWLYDGLFELLAVLWEWELRVISGACITGATATVDAMSRMYGWRFRAKGWAKLALRGDLRRDGRFWTRFPRLCVAGGPRALVFYCARALLQPEARCDESVLRGIRDRLPVLYEGPTRTWEDVARQCVRNWKEYLRRSYV